MKWRNGTPKENGSYLCFMDDCYIKMCFYDVTLGWLDMWESTINGTVKHWQNLPEAPNCL